MKKVIGITGGVGGGKSTVLKILREEYKAEIILTDEVAHQLMQPQTACYEKLVAALGEEVLAEDGTFDKKKLGSLLFGDREISRIVNGIVHPTVFEAVQQQIACSSNPFLVVESALLIEGGLKPLCDEIWYVYVSTQERVKRLYEQRGYSEVKSYSIIHNQMSHSEFRRNSDRLIDNGSSREYTRHQVREFMAELMQDHSTKEKKLSKQESCEQVCATGAESHGQGCASGQESCEHNHTPGQETKA